MARMLRDCTDSEKVNLLKAHAEVLFYRLMMKADDYGSFYANVKLIKSNCYPLRTDAVRDADISRWMDELLMAGLIVVYMHAGKSYLRILNFGQRLRNKKKRFPDCPPELLINAELQQFAANGGELPPEDELEEEVEDELEEEKEERAGAHSPELIADFEKFKVWSQEHAPRVLKMKEPFSIDQFAKIKNDFSAAQISEILKVMHNWEPLLKKNRSAYLTAIKWLQKENNETNRRTTSGGNSGKPGTSEARMQAAKNWGRKEI